MALNPTPSYQALSWGSPDAKGYVAPDAQGQQVFIGTVVAIQEVQAREFSMTPGRPGRPRFWDDGNPVMNIRMAMVDPMGDLRTFTFAEAGKAQKSGDKPSVHMDLWHLTGDRSMTDLIGKTIQIMTWTANPENGQRWGQGNPRLFNVMDRTDVGPFQANVSIPPELTVDKVLCDDAVSGGQPNVQPQVAPQSVQVPQVQPMVQPVQAQPVPQPMQAQPAVQQQPVVAQMPAGMDQQTAAAIQQMGAVNVQPVVEPMDPYSQDEIPF